MTSVNNFFQNMSTPTTSQETSSRGSYLSIAASITAKFKCCISGDTVYINDAHNVENPTPKVISEVEEGENLNIAIELPTHPSEP